MYAGSRLQRPHPRSGEQHPSLLDFMRVLTLLLHSSLLPDSERLLASGKLSVRGIRMQGLHLVSWSTATSILHMLALLAQRQCLDVKRTLPCCNHRLDKRH